MSKSLEALERIRKAHFVAMACLGIEQEDTETLEAINIIEQELRDQDKTIHEQDCYIGELEHENGKMEDVLKIIKEKEVNVFYFLFSGDLETYNDMVEDNRKLIQNEYDLLKEILL